MPKNPLSTRATGHLCAMFTILCWGTTLVATKVLVNMGFRPVEIIFFRFFIGWLSLMLVKPHLHLPLSKAALQRDRWLILAGLVSVPVYYLLENSSLLYTTASNTGLLVTLSPIFVATASHFLLKTSRIQKSFIIGAIICFLGVFLVVFNGNFVLEVNPLGDLLAVSSSLFWAAYSLICGRMDQEGYPEKIITRMQMMFFYGLIFLLPCLPLFGFEWRWAQLTQPSVIVSLLFLGVICTAVCFVTWNMAIAKIGVLSTSLYIYLIPVVTIIFSIIVLGERMTLLSTIGALLILSGLLTAEGWFGRRRNKNVEA